MPTHSWESLARGGLPFDPDLGGERAWALSSCTHTGRPTITRGAGRPAPPAAWAMRGAVRSAMVFLPTIHVTVPSATSPAALSIPKLLEASAGHGLRFRLGVALDASAPDSMRRQVDGLLDEVVPGLKSVRS